MGGVLKVMAGCLTILGFFSIISIITGNDFVSQTIDATYDLYQIVNGTTTDISITTDGTLTLDPLQQAVIWIIIIGAIAVASGLTVVASGLNDTASRWLTFMIFFTLFQFPVYPGRFISVISDNA